MIYLSIIGGLGNQMFVYAYGRALQQLQPDALMLDTTNLRNIDLRLTHFNIAADVLTCADSTSYRHNAIFPLYVLYRKVSDGISGRISPGLSCGITILFNPILNKLGLYFYPQRYIAPHRAWTKDKFAYGYWQSPQYFQTIEQEIKRELQVTTPPSASNQAMIEQLTTNQSVCVHIRRGDYVTFAATHLVCTIDYYKEAMRRIAGKVEAPAFYIFSDDIAWCKENIDFEFPVTFVEGDNPDYEELRLMYSCKHFVLSNSSFSWWAQYLSENPDKVVEAPSKWFANGMTSDIYMDFWDIVEVL